MLYNDDHLLLFSKAVEKENKPIFYSNSNGDKNYMI
jgi:hypothetical protein